MRALLTACTAIACAATQVTWPESPPADRAAAPAPGVARPGGGAGGRTAAQAASAQGASALAVPTALAGARS
jgi:hypothetical protein